MQPWWLDWTAGLFPVIVVVFVLRSFLFEPFKIPSGSMIPTLRVGDLILVNKFHYGVRLPVVNTKIIDNNEPQRGDVMVFRYPPQPTVDYIKRVVGVPGDEVAYLNKRLTINGQAIDTQPEPEFFDADTLRYSQQWRETLVDRQYKVLTIKEVAPISKQFLDTKPIFEGSEGCHYNAEGVVCKVPAGHDFMMGDNRDNSIDSRVDPLNGVGMVPAENLVGKAQMILFSWEPGSSLWNPASWFRVRLDRFFTVLR
jgi:signal peptidase I